MPLVLIHGISGAAEWWAKNLGTLGRHLEVYAPDLPGFGCSPLGARRFDIEDEAAALAAWMAALGVSRAILVGHSMGGYLAAKLALAAPSSVAALILVDPATFPRGYGWWRLALGLVRAPFGLSLDLWPILLRGTFEAGLPTILRAARDLLARVILDELAALRMPSLLIWGKRDSVVPLSVAARVKETIGGAATGPVLLRGGHVPMWDDPDAFDEAVLRFLEELGLVSREISIDPAGR